MGHRREGERSVVRRRRDCPLEGFTEVVHCGVRVVLLRCVSGMMEVVVGSDIRLGVLMLMLMPMPGVALC